MRILLVHNKYRSSAPSGENLVFEAEHALLQRGGHDTCVFVRESDELRGVSGVIRGAAATPWNPWTVRAVRSLIKGFRPDVIHAHNTFPLVSPSVFDAARGERTATVLTLHNYRLFCAAAVLLRDGTPCTECLDRRSVLPALRSACYRGGRLAPAPLAANIALARARGIWGSRVDAFVALTEFQRRLVVSAGLPAGRVHVKPNFYPGTPTVRAWDSRGTHAVFVGRLTPEKGVHHLLGAWRRWGRAAPELRVVGDGPLRAELEQLVRGEGLHQVRFLGQLAAHAADAEIAGARLLIIPSVCFEGFPLVLREAFAHGTPTAVADLGALPDLVGRGAAGVVFSPNDPASLEAVVRTAWADDQLLRRLSRAARSEYELRYAEGRNLQRLEEIYRAAITHRSSPARPLTSSQPSS